MSKLQELIDNPDIRVIDEFNKDYYIEIKNPQIMIITKKAALINGKWFPLSHIAIDVHSKVYADEWIYCKNYA